MGLDQFSETQIFTTKAKWPSAGVVGTYYLMFGEVSLNLRIDTIQIFNSDTIDHNYVIGDEDHDDADAFGAILVPAGSGYGGVPAVDALALIQPAAYHFLLIASGAALAFTLREAVNAGKYVMAYVQGGFF